MQLQDVINQLNFTDLFEVNPFLNQATYKNHLKFVCKGKLLDPLSTLSHYIKPGKFSDQKLELQIRINVRKRNDQFIVYDRLMLLEMMSFKYLYEMQQEYLANKKQARSYLQRLFRRNKIKILSNYQAVN